MRMTWNFRGLPASYKVSAGGELALTKGAGEAWNVTLEG
jgi:hypothetical protein